MTRAARIAALTTLLALAACASVPEPQPEVPTIRYHRPWQPAGLMLLCEAGRV